MADQRIEKIREYEDTVRELFESEENDRRRGFWADDVAANDYIWHPRPKSRQTIPFTIELERTGFAQYLGYSLVNFYTDPIEFVLRSLEIMIFKFRTFEDCTPIGKSIAYWPGVGFEASLMGMPQVYTEHDAWIGREHAIQERVPLDSIERPDFNNHPVMKQTIAFYETMREILADDFLLGFPQWCRSAWGVAWHLRGVDHLIYDYVDDPEWLIGFVDLLADARIQWSKDRTQYLGIDNTHANLYNDEVMGPLISPTMYEQAILPSEKKIGEYFGGINYWHSCGDTTSFISMIDTIPRVDMVHVSPWTDIYKASELYDRDKALEFVLHPITDVLSPASDDALRKRMIDIKETSQGRYRTVRADGFQVTNDAATDMAAMKHWVAQAKEILL